MRNLFTVLFAVLATTTFSSCTKGAFCDDDLLPAEKNLTSKKTEKIAIGRDNETNEFIVGMLSCEDREAGKDGIDVPHVYMRAVSIDNTRSIELFVAGNDQNATIVGDIVTIGLDDGECAWCECVSDHWNEMEESDPTGGWFTDGIGSVFTGPAAFAIGVGCGFAVLESLF